MEAVMFFFSNFTNSTLNWFPPPKYGEASSASSKANNQFQVQDSSRTKYLEQRNVNIF